MSDKIEKIEVRKILQEYNFLLADDEYKKEVILKNKTEFLEKVQKLKSDLGIIEEELKIDENEEKRETIEKQPIIDPKLISNSTKSKIKKLYREIAKKTHPDKTNSEHLVNFYTKATQAADDFNLFELFIICIELRIEIEIDKEDKEVLIKLIDIKKDELKRIESSFIWLYSKYETEEEKNELIKLFVEKHGKNK